MTASHRLERRGSAGPWSAVPADVAMLVGRAAGAVAATAACGCAAVIAARRLAGAVEPATPGLVLAAVAVGAPLVVTADAARRAGASLVVPLAARCGLGLAVTALALPPRMPGPAGWLAVCVALAVTALVIARPLRRAGGGHVARRPAVASPSRRRGARREPRPGVLRQRFERRALPAGVERIRGRVVVSVPAGARTGYGHVGFCPAFATTPTVEVTTAYDGVEATVTAAEVLPWGVRVECRLAEPADESLDIPVDLVAGAAAAPA